MTREKMGKCLVCAIIIIVGVGFSWAQKKPTAIETAKQIALRDGEIDRYGDYVWVRTAVVEGASVAFVLCYSPPEERIYVVRAEGQDMVVLMVDRKLDLCVVGLFRSGAQVGQMVIDGEAAERMTEKLLIEMEQRKLTLQ